MKKRILLGLLAAVMCWNLVSCAGTSPNPDTPTAPEAETGL